MGKPKGFLEFERKNHKFAPAEERTGYYHEFTTPLGKDELKEQAARCMDCGTPFCQPNCPLHNVIPDFNEHIYKDRLELALATLFSTNNFPEFTGRVCPAPCESGCVLGIIKKPVSIKNIEYSIIENSYEQGLVKPSPPKKRSGKKVAVIGSGPAGLACTDQLNKAGHEVTLFEKSDRIGGLLRYGIPDFKLDKSVIDRRMEVMKAEGVIFKTSVNAGVDISAVDIEKEFDAMVLTGGSTIPRDLPIEGRSAKGVHFAMDFLRQNNKRVAGDNIPADEEILATGKNVLVIGGGDTGSDCVGTSIRQGAKSVTQIELLPKPPAQRTEETAWPVFPGPRMFSTSTSQEEGCERLWSILSKEFVTDKNGNLTGVRYVGLEWENGKFTEIENSESLFEVDLVFLAMGFLYPDPSGMLTQLALAKDARGNVKTGTDFMTSREGVFSAGDMRRGQSLVVWAISEGRECARAVDSYLAGKKSRLPAKAEHFAFGV